MCIDIFYWMKWAFYIFFWAITKHVSSYFITRILNRHPLFCDVIDHISSCLHHANGLPFSISAVFLQINFMNSQNYYKRAIISLNERYLFFTLFGHLLCNVNSVTRKCICYLRPLSFTEISLHLEDF